MDKLKEEFMHKWSTPKYKLYVKISNKKGVFAADEVWQWIESKLKLSKDGAGIMVNYDSQEWIEVKKKASEYAKAWRKRMIHVISIAGIALVIIIGVIIYLTINGLI